MNSMEIDAFSDPGRLRESPGARPGVKNDISLNEFILNLDTFPIPAAGGSRLALAPALQTRYFS